jgi:sterol desaturase/sphingolipid hydroxylase (fatty acid hydroxylase superfamily)
MDVSERVWRSVLSGTGSSVKDAVWYAVAAGLLWLGFYVLFRRRMAGRKVVPRRAPAGQIGVEVFRSLRSIVVFGLVTALVVFAWQAGYTRLYRRIDDHSWGWFVASIAVAIVMHDAYFYWTHRIMHHPRLFRGLHRTHHLCTNPTPWAAYAFGTGEAFVQAGIGPLVVCTVPMHGLAFTLFMGWQIAFNVLGHCGYEIFPRWFLRTWAGRLLNTPTHHALHHEKVRGNYGLYFNVWDRLMGTNRPDYEARFARVTGATAAEPEAPREGESEPAGHWQTSMQLTAGANHG